MNDTSHSFQRTTSEKQVFRGSNSHNDAFQPIRRISGENSNQRAASNNGASHNDRASSYGNRLSGFSGPPTYNIQTLTEQVGILLQNLALIGDHIENDSSLTNRSLLNSYNRNLTQQQPNSSDNLQRNGGSLFKQEAPRRQSPTDGQQTKLSSSRLSLGSEPLSNDNSMKECDSMKGSAEEEEINQSKLPEENPEQDIQGRRQTGRFGLQVAQKDEGMNFEAENPLVRHRRLGLYRKMEDQDIQMDFETEQKKLKMNKSQERLNSQTEPAPEGKLQPKEGAQSSKPLHAVSSSPLNAFNQALGNNAVQIGQICGHNPAPANNRTGNFRVSQRSMQLSVSKSSSLSVSPFESSSRPGIPAGVYLQVVCKKLRMPDEHVVCVLILINRVCNMAQQNFQRIYVRSYQTCHSSISGGASLTNGGFGRMAVVQINSLTIHRLILTAVLVIHKFYTDPFYLNSFMSYIGGVQLQEINFLEEEFLDILDFNVSVDSTEYDQYVHGLKAFFGRQLPPETVQIIEEIQQAWLAQQELSLKLQQQMTQNRINMVDSNGSMAHSNISIPNNGGINGTLNGAINGTMTGAGHASMNNSVGNVQSTYLSLNLPNQNSSMNQPSQQQALMQQQLQLQHQQRLKQTQQIQQINLIVQRYHQLAAETSDPAEQQNLQIQAQQAIQEQQRQIQEIQVQLQALQQQQRQTMSNSSVNSGSNQFMNLQVQGNSMGNLSHQSNRSLQQQLMLQQLNQQIQLHQQQLGMQPLLNQQQQDAQIIQRLQMLLLEKQQQQQQQQQIDQKTLLLQLLQQQQQQQPQQFQQMNPGVQPNFQVPDLQQQILQLQMQAQQHPQQAQQQHPQQPPAQQHMSVDHQILLMQQQQQATGGVKPQFLGQQQAPIQQQPFCPQQQPPVYHSQPMTQFGQGNPSHFEQQANPQQQQWVPQQQQPAFVGEHAHNQYMHNQQFRQDGLGEQSAVGSQEPTGKNPLTERWRKKTTVFGQEMPIQNNQLQVPTMTSCPQQATQHEQLSPRETRGRSYAFNGTSDFDMEVVKQLQEQYTGAQFPPHQ